MPVALSEPYRTLLVGDSEDELVEEMLPFVREDLNRAFAAGIRLTGRIQVGRILYRATLGAVFRPTAEMDA
jgi:hypothetical protein